MSEIIPYFSTPAERKREKILRRMERSENPRSRDWAKTLRKSNAPLLGVENMYAIVNRPRKNKKKVEESIESSHRKISEVLDDNVVSISDRSTSITSVGNDTHRKAQQIIEDNEGKLIPFDRK